VSAELKTKPDSAVSSGTADLSGRKQMVGNVLASWGGQLTFIIAGFIMPRMIDLHLGQSLLGVWDFSWSLVGYFSLVQVGIVSSISRYVALHRANHDHQGINRSVSSVTCILVLMAVVIVLLTIGSVAFMGTLKKEALGDHLADARWVVLLLGLEMAVQTAFASFGGVITGCHRWGIHNAITAGSYLVTVVGMIMALILGGGLRAMAIIHFSCEMVAWVARCFIAYRVCPKLSVRFAHATRETALTMFKYGSKAWAPSLADLILNQTTNVLIATSMGPAALAIYARSRNLVKYARELVMKMAAVLVASVSSLHAAGERGQIQELIIKATRYSAFLTLPITTLLAISGGPFLHMWMGSRYADGWVVGILAVGHTGAILQLPVLAILAGMNQHGRLAVANTVGSIVAALNVALVLAWMKQDLVWVALAGTWPLAVMNLVYAPIHTCRRTGLSIGKYFKEAFLFPLICMVPFAACLLAGRVLFADRPTIAFLSGAILGAVLLAPIYWRYVIPPSLKRTLLKRLKCNSRISGAPAIASAAGASGAPAGPEGTIHP
jgi:O-antigen/teichoic acid export membrane protein